MAITWNKIIPRWAGDTIEPPEAKKDAGWLAGDKPPAKWWNWFQKGTYEALDETRDVIEGIDSQLAQDVLDLTNHKGQNVTGANGVHGLKIEEGVFTPTISDISNNQPTSYSQQKGFYQKIGSTVLYHIYLGIATKGANMTGVLQIRGLPFAPKNTTGRFTIPNIGYADKVNIGSGKTLNGFLSFSAPFINLGIANNDGTLQSSVTATMVEDGTAIMLSGQYQT